MLRWARRVMMGKKRDKLPRTMTQQEAIRLLERYGWTQEVGGKHQVKMTKPGCRPITLPYHRGQVYAVGLAQRILKQAGLTAEGAE